MNLSGSAGQDALYQQAIDTYGSAIERLARAYEAAADKRDDLLQEIHLALWRSFQVFEDRCSLRTWIYRVAHNAAISYVVRQSRVNSAGFASLAELETAFEPGQYEQQVERRLVLERLFKLIHRLKPLDRQIMLLYLEDMDATTIGEITGLSPGYVRTQIYRIKAILKNRFHGSGGHHG
jgi:RNA polymerase sigma-70 factor, ECF subfamily